MKELKYKPEKHDYESVLKSREVDSEIYKNRTENGNRNKAFIIVSKILISSVGLEFGSRLTISGIALVGVMCASSISFLSSSSILITDDCFSR